MSGDELQAARNMPDALERELQAQKDLLARYEAIDRISPPSEMRRAMRSRLLAEYQLAQQARFAGWHAVMASRTEATRPGVGLRGGSLRHARYAAGDFIIRLRFEPAASGMPDRVMLHGLLTNAAPDAPSFSGAAVEALDGSDVIAEGSLDPSGNFALHEVQAGIYGLRILLPSRRHAVILEAVSFSNPI